MFWRYKISPWRSVVVCRVKSSVERRELQNFFLCCVIERALREILVLAFCATLACRACGVDACLVALFYLSFPQIRTVSHRTCGCGFAGFRRSRAVAQPPEGGLDGQLGGREASMLRRASSTSGKELVDAPQCCGSNSGVEAEPNGASSNRIAHGPVHVTRQQIGGQGVFSQLGQTWRILTGAHLNMLVRSVEQGVFIVVWLSFCCGLGPPRDVPWSACSAHVPLCVRSNSMTTG